MNKLKKTFNNLKYALPFAAIGLLPQEAKGQDWDVRYMPTEKINLFISQDDTSQALEYNALKTRTERDAMIQSRINPDWVDTIPEWIWNTYPNHISPPDYELWDCGNEIMELMVNSIKLVEGIYGGGGFQDDKYLFNKYKGFNLDSILKNEGTLKDNGKLGLPIYTLTIANSALNIGHGMNFALTGNTLSDWNSYNFIEPQLDQINVQPGEAFMYKDLDKVYAVYWYTHNRPDGKKELAAVPVAFFTITNGVPKFGGLNPYLKDLLITERESDPPIINIKQNNDPDSLVYNIVEKNFKSAWYTVNGGEKKLLGQSGAIKLGLEKGSYIITLGTEDYFRLKNEKIEDRIITAIEPPPTLENILLYPNPAEGIMHIKYKTNMSQNAYRTIYTLDGKPVVRKTIGQMTEEDLDITTLKKGMYIMNIIEGTDKQNLVFIKK
jgi:hypothetical protein